MLFAFGLESAYWTSKLSQSELGQFGDFIGGIVGSLWGLTSTLLFYAALRLQQQELINNERSSKLRLAIETLNRQIDLFYRSLKEIRLTTESFSPISKTTGELRIEDGNYFLRFIKSSQIKSLGEMRKYEALFITSTNSIKRLFSDLEMRIKVIFSPLIVADLDERDISELKKLVRSNFGSGLLNDVRIFRSAIDNYANSIEKLDYKKIEHEELVESSISI